MTLTELIRWNVAIRGDARGMARETVSVGDCAMTDTVSKPSSLGSTIPSISRRWGWIVLLGIAQIVAGGIASTNLIAANFASVLFIGVAMLVAGILQVLRAFLARGVRGRISWQLGGVVYAAAGSIILYDPLLASLALSLAAGGLMIVAGLARLRAGFHMRPAAGWQWIAAAGVLTVGVGTMLVATWPGISLWLLGAMLVVDLIFQGWGLIAFGISLKMRSSRLRSHVAAR